MPRVSRKQADQHRIDVIRAASRLFPQHGIDGVSVPSLMAEAGLTHGAFYGHFQSKEALVIAACDEAFEAKRKYYDDLIARHGSDAEGLRAAFIKRYTRLSHRDERAEDCPIAALCGDIARNERKGPIRSAFAAGVMSLIDRLPQILSRRKKKASREEALTTASMLVGALVLARATEGHAISEEFLSATRKALLES
jgi:TetR/AcrR family transcriptional repressor of nem operon